MGRLFVTIAASSGLLAVAFGAFGAHALKNRLDDYALGVYQTAVEYHFYHTLALLGVGVLSLWYPQSQLLRASGIGFTAGTVIFSGSLYLLAFSGIRALGAITPIGGVALMVAWFCLALAAWRLID